MLCDLRLDKQDVHDLLDTCQKPLPKVLACCMEHSTPTPPDEPNPACCFCHLLANHASLLLPSSALHAVACTRCVALLPGTFAAHLTE